MNYFEVIIALIVGFVVGRFWVLGKKFLRFINNEKTKKQV